MARILPIKMVNMSHIQKQLKIEIKNRYSNNFAPKQYIFPYDFDSEHVTLPFHYTHTLSLPFEKREFDTIECKFTAKLFENQKEIVKQMLEELNISGTVFLAAYTGFGKTVVGTYIMYKTKVLTVILSHRGIITSQWITSIHKFTSAKAEIFNSKSVFDDTVNVYIINPDIVTRLKEFPFEKVGLLIVDEAHVFCSPKRSQSLNYFTPKYALGLSATPDERSDGTSILLTHYFGKKITIPFFQYHEVYKYNTNFVPEYTLNDQGKTDWNSVLVSQAEDKDRNTQIMKICQFFEDRIILILCKRKRQANYLVEELKKLGEDCDIYIASQKMVNYNCRILVSTFSKGGVGFDHPKLNMLILAADVEAFIQQYVGRIFRGGNITNKVPIIVDLLDKFDLLDKHYTTRKRFYKKSGGVIKDFITTFPTFKDEELSIVLYVQSTIVINENKNKKQ